MERTNHSLRQMKHWFRYIVNAEYSFQNWINAAELQAIRRNKDMRMTIRLNGMAALDVSRNVVGGQSVEDAAGR